MAHWKIHKPMCRALAANEVWGIRIRDNSVRVTSDSPAAPFEHVLLKASHPIFTTGERCPVPQICGFPLIIWSEAHHGLRMPAKDDNQPAVYLRIEAHDGFAPVQWVSLALVYCWSSHTR